MILSVIFGLIIWFVLPILLEGLVKKKRYKKALIITCKIFGIAIIIMAILNNLI